MSPRLQPDSLVHFLLALIVIVLAARLVGALFRYVGQPPVIGEMIAGIMLGPSVLGRLTPAVPSLLLSPSIAPLLSALAQAGVILYMFLVGLALDEGTLRKRTRISITVSIASIVTPLLLGALLALWLHPRFSSRDVPITTFALFMGVSMAVTAFPVLARILGDLGLSTTPLGSTALACAAVADVTAWCLLAFVVGVERAEPGRALSTLGLTAAFATAMLLLVRPAARQLVRRRAAQGRLTQPMLTIVLIALLLAALASESIGIHALFGAFLLGAVVPHGSALAHDLRARFEDVVIVLFLPAFFAYTGLRTQVGFISGGGAWLACVLVVAVAFLGKLGGTAAGARLAGLGWREATGLGVLMNTRGLMELVVLTVGLDLGVLSPTLFAMMVVMALVTTLTTTPLLRALGLRQPAPTAEPRVA